MKLIKKTKYQNEKSAVNWAKVHKEVSTLVHTYLHEEVNQRNTYFKVSIKQTQINM